MKEEIIKELKEIEKEKDIKVLYACESGSRSWGFSHPKSDYDVRFIFKWNNLEDYLRLEDKKDVIDKFKGDIDLCGWDIKKALSLHHKNNPELREWLITKDVYLEMDKNYFGGLPEFDPSVLKQHYTGIVNNDLKKMHRGQDEKKLKRRLYDIRCILAWTAIDKGLSPKIKCLDLIEQVGLEDGILKKNIVQIIKAHRSQNDSIKEENVKFIDKWIEESFNMMVEKNKTLTYQHKDKNVYHKRFYEIVTEKLQLFNSIKIINFYFKIKL